MNVEVDRGRVERFEVLDRAGVLIAVDVAVAVDVELVDDGDGEFSVVVRGVFGVALHPRVCRRGEGGGRNRGWEARGGW